MDSSLKLTLSSVVTQADAGFELVVVDYSGGHASGEALREWAAPLAAGPVRIRIVEGERERNGAVNRGLRESEGRYVTVVNPGMLMMSGHISMLTRELSGDDAPDLLYFDMAVRDSDGWTRRVGSDDEQPLRAQLLDGILADGRFAVRRDAVLSSGGYDERLGEAAWMELGCRLIASGISVVKLRCAPQVVVAGLRPVACDDMESALESVRTAVRNLGDEAVAWVDVRRMILAGDYAARGNKTASERLSDAVLDGLESGMTRIKFGFIRDTQAYFGHGAWLSRRLIKSKIKEE